jgi:hypothetical protein
MDTRSTGILIVVIGIAAILIGLLVMTGALNWFGRLPGDIHFERGGTRVYIPITTMILVSAALSLISYLIRRF